MRERAHGQEVADAGGTPHGDYVEAGTAENLATPACQDFYRGLVAPAFDENDLARLAFDFSRVWWGEQGQPVASVSKLLGTRPAYAKFFRYNLINSSGVTVAVTSTPTDRNNNFTVTDK